MSGFCGNFEVCCRERIGVRYNKMLEIIFCCDDNNLRVKVNSLTKVQDCWSIMRFVFIIFCVIGVSSKLSAQNDSLRFYTTQRLVGEPPKIDGRGQ